jgi:hypothetical protein
MKPAPPVIRYEDMMAISGARKRPGRLPAHSPAYFKFVRDKPGISFSAFA